MSNAELNPEPPEPAILVLPRPWGFWFTVLWCVLGFVVFIIAQSAVMVAFMVLRMADDPDQDVLALARDLESNGLVLALATCLSAPVTVGFFALFARLRQWPVKDYLGFTRLRLGQTCFYLALTAVLLAATDATSWLLGRPIVPEVMVEVYRNAGFLPLLILALIVAAPLGEETFFRGFMYRGIASSRAGVWMAILLTSLSWSVIHLQYDAYGIGQVFVSGLFLGVVRWRTGSTTLTILLHGIMNLVATAEIAIHLELVERGLPGLN